MLKACEPLISSLANRIAQDSRRNKSDKLRRPSQHSRFEAGLRREAGFAEEDLREAKEVIDFDDLISVGCEALLDAATRYDPKKGKSPQAFAYKRIPGAMRDLRDEKQKQEAKQAPSDGAETAPTNPTRQLIVLAEKGELDDSFIIEQVAVFLSGYKLFDDWRYFIQDAPFEIIRFFWWFLYKRADDLDPKVGKDKRKQMLGVTTLRYWYLRFDQLDRVGARLLNISGPQHLEIIERRRKAAKDYPAKLDDKQAGRLLSEDKNKPVDGKTIARWRKDMREVEAPPLIREDGSVTLNSQEDHDAWNEYFLRIRHSRVWRRLERRRQQDFLVETNPTKIQ